VDKTLHDLLASLGSDNGMERKKARETVVLIGTRAAHDLVALLDSPIKKVRWEAAKTLAAMVEPFSLPAFIALLRDHESDLRWIATDGLIALGPRSVAPLLESLLEGPLVKGQPEMSARVLRQLSSDNEVLARIVAPVIEALKEPVPDPAIIQPCASQALNDLSKVTGELPDL
jgi:HEAT repeat protein